MSNMGQCLKCHNDNHLTSIVCTVCGARLPWAVNNNAAAQTLLPVARLSIKDYLTELCDMCGTTNLRQHSHCYLCGHTLTPAPPLPSDNAQTCFHCGKPLSIVQRFQMASICSTCGRERNKHLENYELQKLNVQKQQIENQRQQQITQRQAALTAIKNGKLPVYPSKVILRKDEICHFSSSVILSEERVLRQEYKSSSSSISLPIGNTGASYGLGDSSGSFTPISGVVQVDSGNFYITNKRCIYDGASHSFSIEHERLLSFDSYADGLQLHPEGKTKTQVFQFQDGEAATAILSVIMKQFHS